MTTAADPIRFPRAVAIEVAKELHAMLAPLCVTMPGETTPRLKVVGSVRRGKPAVKDLELLFISNVYVEQNPDYMFPTEMTVHAVNARLDDLVADGTLIKRPKCDGTLTWGDDIRLAVHVRTGLPVDFFAAGQGNWWNQLVCRTGGKVSNELICCAAIAKGLKWSPTSAGFLNPNTGQLARTVRSERDVFEIVGLEYLDPFLRL